MRVVHRVVSLVAGLAVLASVGCNELRVFFPAHDYETERPALPAALPHPALLVFTKTNGFRHDEAIAAGVPLFASIAAGLGGSSVHTESGGVFNAADLARFDGVVWLNTSGDLLTAEQREQFQAWLEQGGGFVGVHGAGGDTSYEWDWIPNTLLGAQFIGHPMGPQFQTATVVVEDRAHPATRALPARWEREDEWYSFAASPRSQPGFRVLASLDESSYQPRFRMLWIDRDLSMGDHPVIWSHCVGRGRAFYSALGHAAAAYQEPAMQQLLSGAVVWAAGLEGDGCNAAE